MAQYDERLDPRSGQEPQIQAPDADAEAPRNPPARDAADVDAAVVARDAGEDVHMDMTVASWDAEEDVEPVAWDAQEDAGPMASDARENAGAVAWDGDEDAGAVAWDAGEGADDAVPVPDEPEQRAATGEPRVDAALARLDELAGRPVTEHRAIFEDVHRRLRDVLGELDIQNSGDQAAAGAERPAGR